MNIKLFNQNADLPEFLQQSLLQLESEMTYPLGETQRFAVSHSPDYPAFYRSMGQHAMLLTAEENNIALGTASAVLRHVGAQKKIDAWYIGDLKIRQSARGTGILPKMAIKGLLSGLWQSRQAYGVVMDGTSKTPDAYLGRTDMPAMKPAGKVYLWSFDAKPGITSAHDLQNNNDAYLNFSNRHPNVITACGGGLSSRSQALVQTIGSSSASAMIGDTFKGKQLIKNDGTRFNIRHLDFASWSGEKGLENLICQAQQIAFEYNDDCLMMSLSESVSNKNSLLLKKMGGNLATATIWATSSLCGGEWHINSSEI